MQSPAEPPILWSFRRCPYAMRARMALHVSGTVCWLREIVLRNKPKAMVEASPKGTVPVLVLADGQVIDQSLDIMHWALEQNDPANWLGRQPKDGPDLVRQNDGPFKYHLDRYKYPDRFGLADGLADRAEGLRSLERLNQRLAQDGYFCGAAPGFTDVALAPFVRQFANTDRAWFDAQSLPHLQRWLSGFLASARFAATMAKIPVWERGPGTLVFDTLVFSTKNDDKAGPVAEAVPSECSSAW